jgi:hypothetical protein
MVTMMVTDERECALRLGWGHRLDNRCSCYGKGKAHCRDCGYDCMPDIHKLPPVLWL